MTQYYVGMMSGTSLDGIDAVLARFCDGAWQVVAHADIKLSQSLAERLYRLNYPSDDWQGGEIHAAQIAEDELTRSYAKLYHRLINQSGVAQASVMAIGAHGQTIRHEPNAAVPYTIQLLNGGLLSELTQQTVVCDFRRRDVAVGGQGAPLAPLFHASLFHLDKPFAVVNIGGIANISVIGRDEIYGFDCGSGNCLLDEWIALHKNKAFDDGGRWARQGEVLPELLARLSQDNYFQRPIPKSTGRDYFHRQWLSQYLADECAVDVMRTLVRLTATMIVEALPADLNQLVIVGGGAKNHLLVEDIKRLTNDKSTARMTVLISDELGIDAQQVESLGFALLAKNCINQQKSDTTKITGAKKSVLLGCVYHF